MPFQAEHTFRFDAQGKLDADDWLLVPRAQLRSDFALDAAFADELVRGYFDFVERASPLPIKIVNDVQGVRYLAPLNKTAMVYAEPERIVDANRVETSWRIAGGFMLAHNMSYGGRFYLGAEWQADALKIYSTIRRYPPRLINWFGVAGSRMIYQHTQGALHRHIGDLYLQAAAARIVRA